MKKIQMHILYFQWIYFVYIIMIFHEYSSLNWDKIYVIDYVFLKLKLQQGDSSITSCWS